MEFQNKTLLQFIFFTFRHETNDTQPAAPTPTRPHSNARAYFSEHTRTHTFPSPFPFPHTTHTAPLGRDAPTPARPLSTSSVRDARHSPHTRPLLPHHHHFQHHFQHTQQGPVLKAQYGVFPIRRSTSRLSYNNNSKGNGVQHTQQKVNSTHKYGVFFFLLGLFLDLFESKWL